MSSFAYGIYAISPGTSAHTLGYQSNGLAVTDVLQVWDGPTETRCRFRVHRNGDIIPGPTTAADLATTATDGFVCVRSCNGTPTGAPSNAANGIVPVVYDRSAHKIWAYSGSWRGVAVT